MTTIKVTPEQLLSVSKQFASAQSQIAQMNHILKQQLFEIERQWNGSTKERFYADFIAAQRVMDNFSSLSSRLPKRLKDMRRNSDWRISRLRNPTMPIACRLHRMNAGLPL